MAKPKIGVFSFSSCEGCQLQILNLERELLHVAERIDIVNFREAISHKGQDYEIAFVEGSITREHEAEELKKIRAQAKILVALGACAHLGGVNNLKNLHPKDSWLKGVYGRIDVFADTIPTKKVSDVVKTDYALPGCPIDKCEFMRFVNHLLAGISPKLPDYPVCVECRTKGNPCIVEDGSWCLGSTARAGCGAVCPTFGESCAACRGIVPEANTKSLFKILGKNGFDEKAVRTKYELFNQLEKIES